MRRFSAESFKKCCRCFLVKFHATPNDDCMRFTASSVTFLPDHCTGAAASMMSFDKENQHLSPLAASILGSVPLVDEVSIGRDFVTVKRLQRDEMIRSVMAAIDEEKKLPVSAEDSTQEKATEEHNNRRAAAIDTAALKRVEQLYDWGQLRLAVSGALLEHLYSGSPHVDPTAPHPYTDTWPIDGDSEVLLCIKELIAQMIRPVLQADGGDIRLVSYDDGTGTLRIELLGSCKSCSSSKTTLQDLIDRTTKHYIPEVKRVVGLVMRKGRLHEVDSPTSHPEESRDVESSPRQNGRDKLKDAPGPQCDSQRASHVNTPRIACGDGTVKVDPTKIFRLRKGGHAT